MRDALSRWIVVLSAAIAALPTGGATFVVTTTADSGPGSLRQAILDANAAAGADTIAFAIPGSGSHSIQPTSALPTITEPVVLDGYTQAGASPNTNPAELGSNAVLTIEIDGSNAGTAGGLEIGGGNSIVRGLVINRFGNGGIRLFTNGSNLIEGNFLGTDVTGSLSHGNRFGISILSGDGNTIGGTSPGARNLISGNLVSGVTISGSTGNLVQGNLVGTDLSGTADLGNFFSGIVLQSAPNTIGGATPSARNVISGNDVRGIEINPGGTAARNLVQGNFIGTDVTGLAALPNGNGGVWLFSGSSIIGGAASGAGNVISGNRDNGVTVIDSSARNVIEGNLIGVDATGMAPLGNGASGLSVSTSDNTIGGTAPGSSNVISGNGANGITIVASTGNQFFGNLVGTDAGGNGDLGNASSGILISSAPGTVIGGPGPGTGNVIWFNDRSGVEVVLGDNVTISSNSIYSNGALGIDLGGNGVTPNDPGDLDVGVPNDFQNYPIVMAAIGGAVQGSLDSTPNSTFTVEFFSSPICDPSGFGEGETYLGSTSVTTDASGNATFTATLGSAAPPGHWISATATNANGDTSEFSACQQVISAESIPTLGARMIMLMSLILAIAGVIAVRRF